MNAVLDMAPDAPPVKLCECGCGQPAPIARTNNRTRGLIAGQPMRFLHGHSMRVASVRQAGIQSMRARWDASLLARFWSRVEKTDSCWNWTATLAGGGYGQLGTRGRVIYAHRFSYELHVGQIPAGMTLDHLCRNRACVRPDHLEVVTRTENVLRGESLPAQNARRTHCQRGHALTPENTYRSTKWRACKTCKRASRLARRQQQRLSA